MYQQSESTLAMPTYDEVEQVLLLTDSDASASELHGLVTAFLCGGRLMDGSALVSPLLDNNSLDSLDRNTLLKVYEVTSKHLEDFELSFQLLLPDDDTPLSQRARAMSEWCQGFMIGLKQMNISFADVHSPDSKNALQRFLEISVLDYEQLVITEDDEKAFFEVSEFVRLAVLMIYSELAAAPQHFAETSKVLH